LSTIRFSFEGSDQRLMESLRARSSRIVEALTERMTIAMLKLQQKIQLKLSGTVLQNRDGVLANSVQVQPTVVTGNQIIGAVTAASGPARYGIVQELGGTTTYRIEPVNKKALRLMASPGILDVLRGETEGKEAVLAHVWHPPAVPRPFMAPSLAESIEDIRTGFQETIGVVLEE